MDIHSAPDAVPVATRSTSVSPLLIGFADFRDGFARWPLWTMLGWNDIRQRYRRSTLGPFWITISMALFTVLLGVIYSRIFKQDIAFYLPYIAVGLIGWGLISSSTVEANGAFTDSAPVIKQLRLPLSIFVCRMLWRNFIVFLHTIVLVVPIELFFHRTITPALVLVVPGVALLLVNQVWLATVVSVLSTRFRDMPQLIATAVQISMFATPIMWPVSTLSGANWIADVNPIYHLVEIVRAPMLGEVPSLLSYAVVIGMILLGFPLAAYLLGRASRRLVYWL